MCRAAVVPVVTDPETVRAGYDALGRTYAARRSVGPTEGRLLERALETAPPEPRFLDAGCGPGVTLADLAAAGRAVGIDFSRGQLAIAAEAAPAAGIVRGDITALPFADGSFDAAVSLGVLMHLSAGDQRRAVDELARVLQPRGRLLVSDGTTRWTGEEPDWLGAGVTMAWAVAGIDAVVGALEAAGFAVLETARTPDELAEDDGGTMGLALAELAA